VFFVFVDALIHVYDVFGNMAPQGAEFLSASALKLLAAPSVPQEDKKLL